MLSRPYTQTSVTFHDLRPRRDTGTCSVTGRDPKSKEEPLCLTNMDGEPKQLDLDGESVTERKNDVGVTGELSRNLCCSGKGGVPETYTSRSTDLTGRKVRGVPAE